MCNSYPTNTLLLLLRLLSRGIPPNSRPISVDRQYDTLQQPPMSNTQRYFVQGGRKGELVQSIVRDNPNPECARSGPPPFFPQPIQTGVSDPQEKIKQWKKNCVYSTELSRHGDNLPRAVLDTCRSHTPPYQTVGQNQNGGRVAFGLSLCGVPPAWVRYAAFALGSGGSKQG